MTAEALAQYVDGNDQYKAGFKEGWDRGTTIQEGKSFFTRQYNRVGCVVCCCNLCIFTVEPRQRIVKGTALLVAARFLQQKRLAGIRGLVTVN